jgi:NAD synthase
MNGGLAIIGDVPKTMVYRIAAWRNRRRPDIPENILTKAPSAELRPNQTDQDSLPPYDALDQILELHVEECLSAEEILAQGFDEPTVRRILRLVRIAVQAQAGGARAEGDFARVRHGLADANRTGGVMAIHNTSIAQARAVTRIPQWWESRQEFFVNFRIRTCGAISLEGWADSKSTVPPWPMRNS